MQSEEVKRRVRETNMERYGAEWAGLNIEDLKKRKWLTEIERYGVLYHKSQQCSDKFRKMYPETLEKIKQTSLVLYGSDNYMKNPILAAKSLEHSRRAGPNKLEIKFNELYPFFCFSGDGSYWKLIPSIRKNKNPDFCFPVYPKSDGSPSFSSVTHVVEIFGDYWHGEGKTGESNEIHSQKTIDWWSEIGLKCLVIWEKELCGDLEILDTRVRNFILEL